MEQRGLVCRNVETLAPAPGAPAPAARRRGLLWGLGGTLLSVAGFVAMILFEQYNGMLAELRGDLKHFNETAAEYVKKDALRRYRDQLKDCLKEVQASAAARERLEQELRASERGREDVARELRQLRERLAYLEGCRAAGK
jgi:septal ring factor EnvC (AmiA/AmiB activator)